MNISITFGMHGGHPFTYQVYMADDERHIAMIFEQHSFREQMQIFIKEMLRKAKK